MSATKQYELVYIAAPEATEQQLAELHELVVGITAKFNGTIDRTEAWGRRRLAYTIGRHKEGIYVLENHANAEHLLPEADYTNNSTAVTIHFVPRRGQTPPSVEVVP